MKQTFALLLLLTTLVRAEIVTIYGTNQVAATSSAFTNLYSLTDVVGQLRYHIEIRSNEVCKIIYSHNTSATWVFSSNTLGFTELMLNQGAVMVGPGRVRSQGFITTLEITRIEDFANASHSITIPPDVSGPVVITLQTSTNLTHWENTSPGSFGVSTAERHFRVRAERQIP